MKISDVINSLEFGDLIVVDWLDASEAAGRLEDGRWDTPVQSVGYFLGVKGCKIRHVVIAKEVAEKRGLKWGLTNSSRGSCFLSQLWWREFPVPTPQLQTTPLSLQYNSSN